MIFTNWKSIPDVFHASNASRKKLTVSASVGTDFLTCCKKSEADGLIIGSPNYLGNMTASFRALYERLIFQSLTYNKEVPCCNEHKIPVILIMTSNCAEEMYDAIGYTTLLDGYKNTFDRFVGPTKVFVCGDTLQVKDYSKYHWTMFDPGEKKTRHDETFGDYLSKAYDLGRKLV